MDPDTLYFYFYNMIFNTHALEKISAYFYMAHPYDCAVITVFYNYPLKAAVWQPKARE
jgi:hypothetical protein